jgi:hypothetical protein
MSREKYLANIDRVLSKVVNKKSKNLKDKNRVEFSEDLLKKGFFQKVAFDVYKVDNDPYSDLWVLQDVEGSQYLVRTSNPQSQSQDSGNWSAASNYDKDNITLAYKNVPVARFSSDVYGFSPEEIITFKSALLGRIQDDEDFIKEVLGSEPSGKIDALVRSFPELRKLI